MGKQQVKPSSVKSKSKEIGFSFEKFIPEKFHTPIFLILLLVLIAIYFSPIMFGGKTSSSGDLIQVKSLRQYVNAAEGVTVWNPYIFCGMPSVVTSMSLRWYDLTAALYSNVTQIYSSAFSDYNVIYTFSFIVLAFSTFFFMRTLGAGRGISFLTASATMFSTGILLLFQIGHITKLMSLSTLPFLLMMMFKFQKKIKLLDILLLVLGMHVLVLGAHVQIVFYFALLSAIYFIYFFVYSFVKKDSFLTKQLAKSIGIVAIAGVIALLMSFDTYSQIYEYKPYSTRGTKSVTEEGSTTGSSSNSYEYNTAWSFPTSDLLTFIIPSYNGFGKSTYKGELTQNREYEASTYFGEMTSVDVPMYMGILVLALAMYAIFARRKEPLIQFLGIVFLFFLLISFGKFFPLVYNMLYYTIPFFDNFRVPSMILHLIQLIIPVLAGFGLMRIISIRENKTPSTEKNIRIAALVFSALFILTLILGDSFASWFTARVTNFASSLGQTDQAQYFAAFASYMADMFRGDVQIAFALIAISLGLIYAYISNKINKQLLIALFSILIIFDLFRIGNRGASYADANQLNELFNEPEYISVIKKQNQKDPYRILNLKREGMGSISQNSNFNVYFLQEDFSGYSAVKPRSYQDIVETVTPANLTLWRMLGVKFIVTDQPYQPNGFIPVYMKENTNVYNNTTALPRLYFVDSVAQKSSQEILSAIKENAFDPKKLAFVNTLDFKFDKGDSTSTALIADYSNEKITANVSAKGNNFLFHGTTFLPGWKAYIDGAETKVYKTNHGFQGIVVPSGNHKVEFVYEPSGYAVGKTISLMLNILLFGGIATVVVFSLKKKNSVINVDA